MTHDHPLLAPRLIASNTIWSLAGLVLPAIVALAATPRIVHGFGNERFGVLSLAWVIVGYFGLFDLGLGRAVTRHISAVLGRAGEPELREGLWTGWYMMLAVGVIGLAIALAATPWLLAHVVHPSPVHAAETRRAFWLLAAAVPAVVLTTGFRAALEAGQAFRAVNAVRIPSGLLTYLLPLAALRFADALFLSVAALVVVRIAGMLAYAVACFRRFPGSARPAPFHRGVARELVTFGAWMTVSNVVSPLMTYLDRFVVSAMLSVAVLTFYAAPFDALSKVLQVPSAVSAVLFPAFAMAAVGERDRLLRMLHAGTRAVALLELPILFLVLCFAPELLRLWLGESFAARSATVAQWLMVGIFANSVAQVAFGFVQGLGRSDLTAKLHLVELPLYLASLWLLVRARGIEGAAIAWTLRVTFDMVLLFVLGARTSGTTLRRVLPPGRLPLLLLPILLAAPFARGMEAKLALSALFVVAALPVAWYWGLTPAQRRTVVGLLARRA
jgi:O-antigen/teichoic acid export membrane protein